MTNTRQLKFKDKEVYGKALPLPVFYITNDNSRKSVKNRTKPKKKRDS